MISPVMKTFARRAKKGQPCLGYYILLPVRYDSTIYTLIISWKQVHEFNIKTLQKQSSIAYERQERLIIIIIIILMMIIVKII